MADDHRPLGPGTGLGGGPPADGGKVQVHAEPIALGHDRPAEVRERGDRARAPSPRGSGDRIPGEMREAQIAHPREIEGAKVLETSLQVVAALDAGERGDRPFPLCPPDVPGAARPEEALPR